MKLAGPTTRSTMLRILFLLAAVAAAAGGFMIGASSYDLDRNESIERPHAPPAP